jgi:hypothetical protein
MHNHKYDPCRVAPQQRRVRVRVRVRVKYTFLPEILGA